MEPNWPWVRLTDMRIGVGRRVGPVYVWVSRGVRVGRCGGSGGVGPVGRAAGVVLCVLIAGGMLIGGARVVGGGSFDGRSADEISMAQLGLGTGATAPWESVPMAPMAPVAGGAASDNANGTTCGDEFEWQC